MELHGQLSTILLRTVSGLCFSVASIESALSRIQLRDAERITSDTVGPDWRVVFCKDPLTARERSCANLTDLQGTYKNTLPFRGVVEELGTHKNPNEA